MQISPQGLQKIIQREGIILHAYKDSVGVWTIGTGHTSAAGPPTVTPGLTLTKEENDQILTQDLKPIEAQFEQYVTVPVTQNQYDAIISIVFNVGPKFWHSHVIQKLNAGDVQGAAQAIMEWRIPPEIIGRRRTEQVQFLASDGSGTSGVPDLSGWDQQVSSASSIFTTIKNLFKDNVKTSIPVIAGGSASMFTDKWPYVLGGTFVLAGLGWLCFYLYEKYTHA